MSKFELIDETLQQLINEYLLLPGADALIPINPSRFPSYTAEQF